MAPEGMLIETELSGEPGDRRMTRHGTVEPIAADVPPSATNPCAATAIADADMGLPGPVPGRQCRAEAQRSGLSASTIALRSAGCAGCADADIGRQIEISIAIALWPAGSFLGDFRTPPAPETLHDSRRSAFGLPD